MTETWPAWRIADGRAVSRNGAGPVTRDLAEEAPVAMVYGATTQAVMMASPTDLADFAVGFSLTEGIVTEAAEIESLEVADHLAGIELRMWLRDDRDAALSARRRFMAGPVGCGLCGVDSLDQANRSLPMVGQGQVPPMDRWLDATEALRARQTLHDRTHAVHAAGFLAADGRIVAVREDVGRHNALDKLIGAMARSGGAMADGVVVLTSRVSVEMVQKTAMAGTPGIIAVSAPTAHAVRLADAAGITLATFARGGTIEVQTHAGRVGRKDSHVAR